MQTRGIEGFQEEPVVGSIASVTKTNAENTPPSETEEELRKCWKNVDGEWS